MMKNLIVVGAQWGDEGKGKVVDLLSEHFDIVVRYQGGHNAGHTIQVNGRTIIVHLIPSGILHPGKTAVIGHGLVIDPEALLGEMNELRAQGIEISPERLHISERAHLILPYHRALEGVMEQHRGEQRLGTTMRGIGPAYVTKVGRHGIRVGDLLDPDGLREKIGFNVAYANRILEAFGSTTIDADAIYRQYLEYGKAIAPYVTDTISYLHTAMSQGQRILFEGAQGTMLDIDYGTYPYVTSSSAVVAGASTGSGVPPRYVTSTLGVVKAYTTRVGEGPFPTELTDETGALLQQRGAEFGASTGRVRRCGWFDSAVVRYAVMVNGFDTLALTKLDVLDVFEEIKICVGYRSDGRSVVGYPFDARVLDECEPVYETVPGWNSPTSGITRYGDLPEAARSYVRRLAELVGCHFSLISTGAGRDETIFTPDSPLRQLRDEEHEA